MFKKHVEGKAGEGLRALCFTFAVALFLTAVKRNRPGNQRTSPRSSTSLDRGSVMLRNRALRGGGRLQRSPVIHLRAVAEAGPLARTTATPHLPWPDDNAKMLSASASATGTPSQVDTNLQAGVLLQER